MAELAADPEYQELMAKKYQQHEVQVKESEKKGALIVEQLRMAGVAVTGLRDVLLLDPSVYGRAVPVLASFMTESKDDLEKYNLAALLASPNALGAGRFLIDEFKRLPPESKAKWKIGDALSECATVADFEGISQILKDKHHGKSREMVVLALTRIPGAGSTHLLMELLTDDQIAGHALLALGRLEAIEAESSILPLLRHKSPFVRQEAKRALGALIRAGKR